MGKTQLDAVLNLIDVQINPQVFRKISQAVAGMPAALQQTTTNLKGASTAAGSLNTRLQGSAAALSQNERAARLFLNRMAQFAILLPTFATLNRAIQGGVKFLFDFDDALRDIVRVDVKGLAGRIEEIGDAALKTAVDFGVTAQEVLNVTKIFVQAGLTIEDSQKRAQLAILATQVSTLSSADAVEFFISASKQFKLSNEDLVTALDALVHVEDLAAVEAQDVAEAFRTGGNSLAEFGKNINEVIGLVSALREQTRKSGAEIGTFFKTLQARIFAAGESRTALEALGVTVENLDGTLRPTLAVLNDMKAAFNGLTEAQAANAAKSIAGVRQFESLVATLNSLDRANELARKANESAGTADLKRTITDEKLDRQLGKLIAQGQAFAESLGDAGVENALKDALKVATTLLSTFTTLVDTIGKLGGNLAPLLALGGIQLGRSIFGLSGIGTPGGGAPKVSQPGQRGFVGPLTPQQSAAAGAGKDLMRFGSIVVDTSKWVGQLGKDVLTQTTMTAANSVQFNIDTQALKQHSTAIKNNLALGGASAGFAVEQKKVFTNSAAGLVALSIAATFLPKVFQALEVKAETLGGTLGKGAATFVGVTGEATTMAAQFAFLGPEAAGIAAVFGALKESSVRLIDAFNDNEKAFKERIDLIKSQGNISGAQFRIQGGGKLGADAADTLFSNIANNVKGKALGNDLNAAIAEAFKSTATSAAFKDLSVTADELRSSVFDNIGVLKNWINLEQDNIRSTSQSTGSLDQFDKLMSGLQDGTLNTGQAFALLVRALGAVKTEIHDLSGPAFDFKELMDVQKVVAFGDELRSLGLELQVAKLGPKALADDFVRLQNEFLLVQRASDQTSKSLDDQLGLAITNLGRFNLDKKTGFPEKLNNLLTAPDNFDQKSIDRFKVLINELPKLERDAAEEVLKIIEAQLKNKIELQKAENAMVEEQQRRTKATLDEQVQASQNAFESTRKFTSELLKFGEAVDSGVLKAFQSVTTKDIEDTLSGNSKLSQGIQEIILSAFGENKAGNQLAKANTNLNATADQTQAELDILARKLDNVNNKLADSSRSNEKTALTAEKHGILLAIEDAKQRGAISATEAKIKVLEAERDAAKAAKEEEEKRHDMLQKLADASRALNKELRDSELAFKDMRESKFSDLVKKDQEAQSELQSAQKDVLSSTEDLSSAYQGLIQAQLEFGNAIAEAQIKSNLLSRDIGLLTGQIFNFDGKLSSIGEAFNNVLSNSNITLAKRIDLERQLADETLAFLKQAQDEIVHAGIGIFGQSPQENQALGQGIAGLQAVAQQLGGSFQAFLNLTQGQLTNVSNTLLSLPAEFRKQILDALSFLPSTMNVGGFSVDQLTQAIGQVGAGVAPEAGLPSIEELTTQQVEQMQKLQDLALQDAQLQYSQVVAAQAAVEKADEQLQATKLLEQRATEHLSEVRNIVAEEAGFLDVANQERRELLSAVIATDDRNTLMQVEKEAQLFADQNKTFRDVGDEIVRGISSAIGARLAQIEAQHNVNSMFKGYIPNFAGGNLTPAEAAGLLHAGMREKRAMPNGAGLAVANTSEAIIPMRNRGFIPNFDGGNSSPIAAGIEAIKSINQSVVAAIAQSVTQTLSQLQTGGTNNSQELFQQIVAQLDTLNGSIDEINASNAAIQSNTAATETTGTVTPTAAGAQEVRITLQTNQNNTVAVTGLENLRSEITAAVKNAASDQVDAQLQSLLDTLDGIITTLQERGLLSSFSQPR